jgi:hypothetical protein
MQCRVRTYSCIKKQTTNFLVLCLIDCSRSPASRASPFQPTASPEIFPLLSARPRESTCSPWTDWVSILNVYMCALLSCAVFPCIGCVLCVPISLLHPDRHPRAAHLHPPPMQAPLTTARTHSAPSSPQSPSSTTWKALCPPASGTCTTSPPCTSMPTASPDKSWISPRSQIWWI